MTIRARLLALLLPAMLAFVVLISIFYYVNWYKEIIDSFKNKLHGIVVFGAQTMDPQKIVWIDQHLHDPGLEQSELYERNYQKLQRIKEKLPMTNVYIIKLEPILPGEHALHEIAGDTSQGYDQGHDHTYRQVYLLDPRGNHPPGSFDYAGRFAQRSYISKDAVVTPFFEKTNGTQIMTAFAPILDGDGQVIGLLAADLNHNVIDNKLNYAIKVMVVGGMFTMGCVILSVYFIANRISRPVKRLKNAALAIAAGDYSENVEVRGPREIAELANTLNTMSECLKEHISRLQENSKIRERLYGEFECTLLLQHEMLDHVVQNFNSPFIALRSIKSESTSKPFGLLLKTRQEGDNLFFSFLEAKEKGFQGSYRLATHTDPFDFPHINLKISHAPGELHFANKEMPAPIIWSADAESFASDGTDPARLNPGDLIFVYNQGFDKLFESRQQIMDWFRKVLKHFAREELDLFMTMLKNELNFLAKRHHIDHDLHLFCLKAMSAERPHQSQDSPHSLGV